MSLCSSLSRWPDVRKPVYLFYHPGLTLPMVYGMTNLGKCDVGNCPDMVEARVWSNNMPAYKQVQIRKVSMLRCHELLAVGNGKNKWMTEVGFMKRAQKLLHILLWNSLACTISPTFFSPSINHHTSPLKSSLHPQTGFVTFPLSCPMPHFLRRNSASVSFFFLHFQSSTS